MHEYQLLEIMAFGFALALAFGFITQKLGLSSIVGYLLAGFCIGPLSPGFVADSTIASQLAEAGVILLMFGVGLHFKTDDLIAVKGVAIPGAIIQSAAATICGIFAGMSLGLDLTSSIILGIGLSVASTVVLLRVLSDNNVTHTIHGHVAVGWLVVEDIFTVLVLVLLPLLPEIINISMSLQKDWVIIKSVALAVLRLSVLWVFVMGVGGKFVPWILGKVAKTRSEELFTLTVLVIAFTTAVIAASVFQASFALGAFLGGMVVGKTKVSHKAASDMLPLRDAFAVLFFLSVGMLFAPKFIIEHPLLVAACLAITLLIKPLTATIAVTILGYSPRTALTVAAGLSQVGEFSFILAQEAKRLNLTGDAVYNAIVITSIISITLNPTIFKNITKFEFFLKSKKKLWKIMNSIADKKGKKRNKNQELAQNLLPAKELLKEKIAIVVGYGPTGKQITRALSENNITPVIIEMNVDTVNALTSQGHFSIYGDSTKKNILEAAGIEEADYLIITLPSLNITSETAALAVSLNPKTRILARARFLSSGEHLKQIGIAGIAFEEQEVAKSLTALLLDDLERQKILQTTAEIASEEK
ncbi:MAG: cation:proton antiporter [Endomicrobium sp.]|jgi:CPA2 family monovalent cation:H+ antiporter-2|nr:cation:proton antiporter [Endomicrobium sp.]